MTLLGSTVAPVPNRLQTFTTWLVRVAIALAFVSFGSQKFQPAGLWVHLFAQIGLGQWFRYATGVLQIGGALLVLVPATSLAGIAILACTMAGAVLAWFTVLHAPGNAPIPGFLLVVLVAAGVAEYNRRRAPPADSLEAR